MSKLILNLSAIAALAVVSVTPAYAQPGAAPRADTHPTGTTLNPKWETSLGYQLLHVPDQTFPFGVNVDGAYNFGALGVAAEAGWAMDTSNDATSHVFNVGAGPRWTGRSKAAVWPFAQVLAGFTYSRFGTNVSGVETHDTSTNFMVQPGAGAVFVGGDGWGIVGQVDYRRVFLNKDEDGESGRNDFRVFIGIRFILD